MNLMKTLKALIAAAILLLTFSFAAPAAALTGGLVPSGCHYNIIASGNGGSAYCNAWDSTGASGSLTHTRVMIVCGNEQGQTGWLYGPWKYAYYAANRIPAIRTDNSILYCPNITQTVRAITSQIL